MGVLGSLILLISVALVLFAPRRWALLTVMASVLFLTKGMDLHSLGASLYAYRIIEVAAFSRVAFRGELRFKSLNRLDYAVFIAYGYAVAVFLLRTALGHGTSANIALVSTMDKVGMFADVILCFLAFRGLLQGIEDLQWLLVRFAVLLVPFVMLLSTERLTGHNPFAAIGGIPHAWIEPGGRVECFGSFMHPSLLGTLGASFLSLYAALALGVGTRFVGVVGMLMCTAIVLLANSGGPLTLVATSCIAWMLWPLRHRMSLVRFSILGAFVGLALAMKAPIWYLPDRLSAIFGGDGWHRSYLMQLAIENINQWWLAGMPLDLTRHWFPYLVMGAVDITNFYLLIGFDGGLLALVLFVWIFVRAFSAIGRALPTKNGTAALLTWGLGAAIVGHLANFLAITYFDQTNFIWLMQLAAVAGLGIAASRHSKAAAASARPQVPRTRTQSRGFVIVGRGLRAGPQRAIRPDEVRPRSRFQKDS